MAALDEEQVPQKVSAEELPADAPKDMFNIADMAEWKEPEWEHNGTHFKFVKMPAMNGWRTLERIRQEFGQSPALDAVGNELDSFIGFMRVLLSLDMDFVESLRETMFKYVMFKTKNTTFQKLQGAEDMAFEHIEPVGVYQVLGRSLVVNFFESFVEMLSLDSESET